MRFSGWQIPRKYTEQFKMPCYPITRYLGKPENPTARAPAGYQGFQAFRGCQAKACNLLLPFTLSACQPTKYYLFPAQAAHVRNSRT